MPVVVVEAQRTHHDRPVEWYVVEELVEKLTDEAAARKIVRAAGTLPLLPDRRMSDFRALWKESPCGSPGSRRVRSLAS